jgi:branched-chain amino acid transport system substrate-binding protein
VTLLKTIKQHKIDSYPDGGVEMHRMIRRASSPTSLCLVLVALLLLTAGCGGSDTKQASRTAGSSTTPLRVAVFANVTGTILSGEQRVPDVLKAWEKAQNAEGGVAGHPVEIVIEDTKNDPAVASAAAAKVTADTSFVAAVSFDAIAEGVYAKQLVSAGIPVIGGMGYDPRIWGATKNWLSVATNFPSVINAGMVLGKSVGAKKPAYVVCAEVATCEAIGGIAESASKELGMSYAGTVKVAAATPDYTAQCLGLIKEGVDFIALGHAAQVDIRFAKTCTTQGFSGRFAMSAGAVEPAAMEANDPGATIDLALNAFPWFADDAPAKAYRDLMEEQGVPERSWADPRATAAYATMELFKKTLDANASSLPETPAAEDVLAAYGTIEDETLDGLLPQPISFTPGQPEPPVSCYWEAQYDGGAYSGASLGNPTCDPPELLKG